LIFGAGGIAIICLIVAGLAYRKEIEGDAGPSVATTPEKLRMLADELEREQSQKK